MSAKQPKALRLASYFDGFFISEEVNASTARKTADELRRLHAKNAVLITQLSNALEEVNIVKSMNQELLEVINGLLIRVADDEEYGPDHAVTIARAAIAKAIG